MDYTVFKTDRTFTRMQRPKLFFSRPHLCFTAPEGGGSFNTHQPSQVTKNMLVLGTSELCWALLHWPVWSLLVTIQVSGQNSWASRVWGMAGWEACGHLVCWWSAEREDGQGRLDLGIHLRNGHTAAVGCREQMMCQVRPPPGQLAEALLKHTGPTGLREINSGH